MLNMKQLSNKTSRRIIGDLGESLACKYLESKGYSIVDRNYSRKCGELDIIAKDANRRLRFIEVKSKTSELSGYLGKGVKHETSGYRPEDNVNPAKIRKLVRISQVYLQEKYITPETKWQFDVIVVYLDKVTKRAHIRYLENVMF
jgi:putative endonuclease